MKKKTIFIIILCFIFAFLFFNNVSATVGGGMYLYDFRYDKDKGAIYFIESYTWWSKIIKYDIASLEKKEIAHVGQIMAVFPEEERDEIAQRYGCLNNDGLEFCVEEKRIIAFEEKQQRMMRMDSLPRIDLAKNDVGIDISAVIDQGEEGQSNLWGFTEVRFTASVAQKNLEKGKVEFYGYYRDDLHADIDVNFDGFWIPNTDNVLILVGTRGQPDEGGYIKEKFFMLDDIRIIDDQPLPLRELEKCYLRRLPRDSFCDEFMKGWYQDRAMPSTGGIFINIPIEIENLPSRSTFEQESEEEIPGLSGGGVDLAEEEPTLNREKQETEEDVDFQDWRGGIMVSLLIAGAILAVAILFLLYLKKKQKISSSTFIIVLVICLFLFLAAFFFPKKCGGAGVAPGEVCKCFGIKYHQEGGIAQPICFGICHSCWDVTTWLGETMESYPY